ncbi:MAG TPA: S9 family peptidase [Symbiobacteriaceae bacterium]|nr:S9 family peptidase [Symbiobacteriaceae bacterium]
MGAYPFEQYFATYRIVDFTPSPDGAHVYFIADISGQFNLWRVATAGGWPQQLTTFTDRAVRSVAVSADGTRLAFTADFQGNEASQIYLMKAEGGWPERLTDRTDAAFGLGGFSPDGHCLVYTGNAESPAHPDLYLHDLVTGSVQRLTQGEKLLASPCFSPDGRSVLAWELLGNDDQNFWVIDLASGGMRCVTAHPGRRVKYFEPRWDTGRNGFYFLSDEPREFLTAGYCDLQQETREYVIAAPWDIEDLTLSADGWLLAYNVNEAGNSVLHVIDRSTGRELPLPALPKGVMQWIKFAPGDRERRLFVHMSCYNSSFAVYVLDLERGEFRLLTPSMLGNIPEEGFVAPELVFINSFDGLSVPAWLYRPRAEGPVPVVVSIHGGPEYQERTDYRYGGFYQYLLSRGVGVLAPNIRGSTGFGGDWQRRILRDYGGAELRDIEACALWLQAQDWVDGERLAIWGGSFGGFAALSAISRLPRYWACAAEVCGPSDLLAEILSCPPEQLPMLREQTGDPVADREFLIARSPITYVENVRCPLMVVQGANDPRVLRSQSDAMVERLRALGREVEYLVFEDEGHQFTKRSNQLKSYKAQADFLLRHLR